MNYYPKHSQRYNMIEPIALQMSVSSVALSTMPAPATMPVVSSVDQARFQAALHGVVEPTPFAVTHPAVVASERITAPGDRILRSLERLRGEYRAVGTELDTLSHRADLTAADLLNIQMHVAQVTLGTQLIGQVASKLEQNLNTLLKSQ